MAAIPTKARLLPSLFDRLLDPTSMGSPSSPGYNEREMLNAVRADLEDLLNTRNPGVDIPEEYVELENSVYTYGLPDLSLFNGSSPQECAELARVIGTVVALHEPRLKDIKVKVSRNSNDVSRSVKFHIDAKLNVDPAPEVGFETVLELATGRTTVSPSEGI